jgi:hypothetical protein
MLAGEGRRTARSPGGHVRHAEGTGGGRSDRTGFPSGRFEPGGCGVAGPGMPGAGVAPHSSSSGLVRRDSSNSTSTRSKPLYASVCAYDSYALRSPWVSSTSSVNGVSRLRG